MGLACAAAAAAAIIAAAMVWGEGVGIWGRLLFEGDLWVCLPVPAAVAPMVGGMATLSAAAAAAASPLSPPPVPLPTPAAAAGGGEVS